MELVCYIPLKRKQNLKKYMLWSHSVHLIDPKDFIHDPFSFDTHDNIIQPNHYVVLTHYEFYFLSITSLVSFLPYYLP